MKYKLEKTEQIIEKSVGQLGRGLFRLIADGHKEEAYTTMGIIMDMLMEERAELRKKLENDN